MRALKEAFGTQFIGGLRPSRYALDHYPDCVVDDSFDFAEHLRQTKINLINVNTDGLHNSTGWKLAEMLAAATCVVAERPKHKLPVPLTEGLHYQSFTTPDECVAACRILLADAELANNMRHANYAYYRHQVRPDSLIERCLVEALLKGEEFKPAKHRTKAA